MDKEDAIEYLRRKGKIRSPEDIKEIKEQEEEQKEEERESREYEKQLTPTEKAEIEVVMKRGKIYGDPLVEIEK